MPTIAELIAAKERGDREQKERNRLQKNKRQVEYYQANKDMCLEKQKTYRQKTNYYNSYSFSNRDRGAPFGVVSTSPVEGSAPHVQ